MSNVEELVTYFESKKNEIKSTWNEAQTRIELINPFFECLGWDVNNKKKLPDPYKDVKHEASLKIGSHIKAPDYSFNYGKPIFFLEAKKPGTDIRHDITPSFQLRRYGWTARMPISILSDFEELAIYDCSIKPHKNDNSGIARLYYYSYTDYINKWNEIYNFISKEAVLHGSLIEIEKKLLKGTATIDNDFLNFVEDIRKSLTLEIAKRNPNLTEKDLNFAIQMLIDRIIFIRICEDRGFENYGSLKEVVNKDNCYNNLITLFQKADNKYNSGLFHFKTEKGREEIPDLITSKIKISDIVLRKIINDLYYPDCPYALDVISSEILGNVYECFIGKVITLTDNHKAKIDYKPEIRKTEGVYYTPHHIVEYIVKNTVGELIKNKTPEQISNIKILDPACGSGSFLVEAYQYLLDYHYTYYNNNPNKWKNGNEEKICESQTGSYLTLKERKRILLNNIFGVDIDSQAVEVTKFSLLLKVLEYEGFEVRQKLLSNDRVLPDLYKNIKCGNSLIGGDFYKDKNLSLFDKDEIEKINGFDWEKKFSEIFKNDGFDVVIGNPPYVFTRDVDWGEDAKKYHWKYFNITKDDNTRKNQSGKINLYILFLLKAINLINKNGLVSFIIPNGLLRTTTYDTTREYLLKKTSILEIIDLKDGVFKGVTVPTIIIKLGKYSNNNKIKIIDANYKIDNCIRLDKTNIISQESIKNNISYTISIFVNNEENKIFEKMKNNSFTLGEMVDIFNGIATMKDKKGISNNKINEKYKKILFGKDIKRYFFEWSNKYIEYDPRKLHRARNENIFLAKEKLIMQRIGGILITTYDDKQYYTFNSVNNLLIKNNNYSLKFILGLLNSKLMKYYYIKNYTNASNLTVNISKTFLDYLPIRKVDFTNSLEKKSHDQLVSLIDQMLETQKQFHNTKSESDKKTFKQKIDIIDNQIDDLVYKLYNLTDDEIKIIEDYK